MRYANRTFVSFDGDTDMHYYRLMTAWKQHDHMTFNFYNAHDLNSARIQALAALSDQALELRPHDFH